MIDSTQRASGPVELARAKVNLCLHVTGQRPDGYHLLDSLVVFPNIGDRVEVEPSQSHSLTLAGPFGLSISAGEDNLVALAARMMGQGAAILLEKNLPVAAGLGGGSADAAAVLRILSRQTGTPLPENEVLARLGADVPVCLSPEPQRMRGIGEVLELLPSLPPLWCVLANAGPMVDTATVFTALETKHNPPLPALPEAFDSADALLGYLANTRNDLEVPARRLQPVIGDVISALNATTGCALARMSGSGGTCFGLYLTEDAALNAAASLRTVNPGWWVSAAAINALG